MSVFFRLFGNPLASLAKKHLGFLHRSGDTGRFMPVFLPTGDLATASRLEQGRRRIELRLRTTKSDTVVQNQDTQCNGKDRRRTIHR